MLAMALVEQTPPPGAHARIEDGASYYALTLTADETGNVVWSSFSGWVGRGSKTMWEMRAPSLVNPHRAQAAWKTALQPSVIVNDITSFGSFIRAGGNALVKQALAQRWLQDVLEPVECVSGSLVGSRPLGGIPKASLNRAPSKKLRMDVLRRDDFRCRICGRRAADNVDIVLHAHHIRPYGLGGLTEASNLITLCHTCHCGLDPHFEVRLLGMVPQHFLYQAADIDYCLSGYEEGVRLYRRVSAPAMLSAAPTPQSWEYDHAASETDERNGGDTADTASKAAAARQYSFEQGLRFWHQVVDNRLQKVVRPHGMCGDAMK